MNKYLSIDTETTGLSKDSYIVEFAAVPVNLKTQTIERDLAFVLAVKPAFDSPMA